ncbi:putative reverse transcriptase domain-containing protein [Tanacetum coccineum]
MIPMTLRLVFSPWRGVTDAEFNMAHCDNYMTEAMLEKLGFARIDYGDYGRKMAKDVEGGPCKLCVSNVRILGPFAEIVRAAVKQVEPVTTVEQRPGQGRNLFALGKPKQPKTMDIKLEEWPSIADFHFISTKFAPLLNMKPSIVSPRYVIEVAKGKKEELSKNKAEIVCHEKVVRISLEGGEILHVQGERTLGGRKTLMSTKTCRDYYRNDKLSSIGFYIHWKASRGCEVSYRLAPRKCKSRPEQLQEFQDRVFCGLIKSLWGSTPVLLCSFDLGVGTDEDGCRLYAMFSSQKLKEMMIASRVRILSRGIEAGKGWCNRTMIMDKAHKTWYSVHPGADKMYHDLRDMYWWPGMNRDIAIATDKVVLIKEKLKVARDRQKSYVDNRRKPLEFEVGDQVLPKLKFQDEISLRTGYCDNRGLEQTFLACNPRDYDGKGGAITLTRWIKKMESVIDNSGCAENQKVKYAASSFINKALTWWNTQVQARGREATVGMTWVGASHAGYTDWFHELAKQVIHLVTLESKCIERYIKRLSPQIRRKLRATQPTMIQSAILKVRILTNEAVCCGILIRSSKKRKEVEEISKQGGSWKDNRGNVAPISDVRMGNNQRVCYECGSSKHLRNTCPKLNRAPGQAGNRLALEGNRNTRNNGNQARGRAFNVNAVDALQDPNVVTGTFSLNDHFATVLFDSRADFSFISTKFAPLLNVKPSIVSPGYVIEVANGKKEEVDRIIRDCKLELGNSLFTIDLIPLGHGSFDVIVGLGLVIFKNRMS